MEWGPWQIAAAASMTVGCLMWAASYLLIMVEARRARQYGYPLLYTCAGLSYEVIQGFVIEPTGTGVIVPLQVAVMRLWFLVDLGLVIQLLLYAGRSRPTRRLGLGIFPLFGAVLAAFFLFELWFIAVTDDRAGHLTGYLVGAFGALSFVGLAYLRPNSEGLSYPAAWLKLVATLLITVPHALYYPIIDPQRSYLGLWILYGIFTGGDLWYLAILHRRRRAASSSARIDGIAVREQAGEAQFGP
jgi:hypothetical protein